MGNEPFISIVLSFRNEEAIIPEMVRRLQQALRSIPARYEIIYVNDVSTDRSVEKLLEIRQSVEPSVRIINMARRCGVAECALAGMEHAKGDAVVLMDADLQDPPELIPELVKKWQDGADVVYTVRASRAGESAVKMFFTRMAYKCIRAISEIDLPENAGDFKLIGRRALVELLRMKNEQDPYLRGLVTWTGFKQVPVVYHRLERAGGITHFPVFGSRGPVKTLLTGLTSFSTVPLLAFLLIGAAAFALAIVAALGTGLLACFGVDFPRWWHITVFFFVLSSIQLAGIGVVALYISRIFKQIRNRPNYTIESLVGFE